jgi:hypothetical protein
MAVADGRSRKVIVHHQAMQDAEKSEHEPTQQKSYESDRDGKVHTWSFRQFS